MHNVTVAQSVADLASVAVAVEPASDCESPFAEILGDIETAATPPVDKSMPAEMEQIIEQFIGYCMQIFPVPQTDPALAGKPSAAASCAAADNATPATGLTDTASASSKDAHQLHLFTADPEQAQPIFVFPWEKMVSAAMAQKTTSTTGHAASPKPLPAIQPCVLRVPQAAGAVFVLPPVPPVPVVVTLPATTGVPQALYGLVDKPQTTVGVPFANDAGIGTAKREAATVQSLPVQSLPMLELTPATDKQRQPVAGDKTAVFPSPLQWPQAISTDAQNRQPTEPTANSTPSAPDETAPVGKPYLLAQTMTQEQRAVIHIEQTGTRMEVHVTLKGHTLEAQFVAAEASTTQLLQQHADELRQMLDRHGVNIEQLAFSTQTQANDGGQSTGKDARQPFPFREAEEKTDDTGPTDGRHREQRTWVVREDGKISCYA